MYKLLIECLLLLKCLFDYEYETGIEFKCIDKETYPEEYQILKDKILPIITNEDKYKRITTFIKKLEDMDKFYEDYIKELNDELDEIHRRYNIVVYGLTKIDGLLGKSGINSKKLAKEEIKKIFELVDK